MKQQFSVSLFVISVLLLSACAAKKPWYKHVQEKSIATIDEQSNFSLDEIDYEIYMVGDISSENANFDRSNVVDLIKSQLGPHSNFQSVVFLGNTIGKNGLPEKEDLGFDQTNKDLEHCIRQLEDNADKVFFVPGNNEWSNGHSYNLSGIQESERFIEEKVNDKNIFVPSQGCGEPKVVALTNDLLLVLIDSQWVLQGDDSSERKRSSCEIDDEIEFVSALEDVLSGNKDKNVIIASHHPVYSNGFTGGNYPVINHFLPLPILGTALNSIKQLAPNTQKIGHPQYEVYRSAMKLALSNFEGIISASAHDRNMQYILKKDNHYVVAGSGANVDYVRKGGIAEFAAMEYGFAKITHTKNLELWLEFFKEDPNDSENAISIYRKRIYKKEVIDYSNKEVYKNLDEYPKTKSTVASTHYINSGIGQGETYRKEWSTEIDAPILLLDEVEGGLKPVQQGGGFQTKSLRLENKEGTQWVVRSIDKDIQKIVPPALRNTVAENILQDGLSAAHPYGAIAIPQLAEAAKIYHANPKIVWLPKQKSLGDYNLHLAERLYLFEERPGGNIDGHLDYGGASESVSTSKLIEKLLKNHKHEVDQKYVLRARVFDLLIGDWDRHDDQWRWGIYESDTTPGKKIYRAIPRDRDQVFFKNDGLLNYIVSRPYISPGLRKFESEIKNVSGLSFNARHFDRHFISQMNEEDFVEVAEIIQEGITDSVIARAFGDWPKAIYDISGESIISKLKERRDNLVETSRDFYKYLTKEVTVIGTNGQNVFNVTAKSDNMLLVEAFHKDGDVNNLIWSRLIDGDDCQELRLFGLKKKDVFNFYGDEKSTIKVRLVGGSGDDIVNNESSDISVLAYDRPDGMSLNGINVVSKLSNQKGVNHFDRKDWKIDRTIHFPLPSFYTDEGVGLGYNVWWQRNGFRKNPYQSDHRLGISYFWDIEATLAKYNGHWPMVLGPKWDFKIDAEAVGPIFAQYFYGLGNEYVDFEELFPDERDASATSFFTVQGIHLDFKPQLVRDIGNNRTLSFNSTLEYFNFVDQSIDDEEAKFIFTEEANRTSADFEGKMYGGLGINFRSDRVNKALIPTRGYIFTAGADYKQSLSNSKFSNLTFLSNIKAYIPFTSTHKVVLATNFGGAYTLGDYEFFHANYLSRQSRLRGYKTNRFAGDGIVYHASDLRIKLFQGEGEFKFGLGVFGSFDYGRSFLENENVDDWHTSYGGGIYLTPLNLIGFKIGYYLANEDSQLSIGGSLAF